MKRLVVLTGAGMSAESGIKTFRDSGGMWEEHDVMQVASIDGWFKNPGLMLEFYNQRRSQLSTCQPNQGHHLLADLEHHYDISIITQNIDNLHERAGSTSVLHLHGEITKARSVANDSLVTDIGYRDIHLGDVAADGHQLRPHIVWFGEAVPAFERAIALVKQADIFLIIGTSLNVYPAAGLVNYVPDGVRTYIIDPAKASLTRSCFQITKGASQGMLEFVSMLHEHGL